MRFLENIYAPTHTGCWIWTAALTEKGYGHCWYEGRTWRVHRLVYYLLTGDEPPVVMHICDEPSCCNPLHLKAGTAAENNRDKAQTTCCPG